MNKFKVGATFTYKGGLFEGLHGLEGSRGRITNIDSKGFDFALTLPGGKEYPDFRFAPGLDAPVETESYFDFDEATTSSET